MSRSGFRNDINGLRAIAVMLVVLFHFGISEFKGGFVGVDIFFVISGFLMTKIIFSRLENKNFSVLSFYLDRSKRIIPALLFTCFILALVGWFYMPPMEYRILSKHIFSSVLFISNIIYFTESGYFNLDSGTKWLLHTWSLSVEWQFYIIYPIILLSLYKLFGGKTARKAILILLILSFFLSFLISPIYREFSYYMLPTRSWEMLLGGAVFCFGKSEYKNSKIISIIGLVLIIASLFIVDSSTYWPGYLAAIPTIGAAMVIAANYNSNFLYSNQISSYIGKVSYSLYLWHWPVIVAMKALDIQMTSLNISYGIIASILLASVSYFLIEEPIRKIKYTTIYGLISYVSISVSTAAICFFVYLHGGLPARASDEVITAENDAKLRNSYHEKCLKTSGNSVDGCVIGGEKSKNPSVILIGDSHSDSTLTALVDAIPKGDGGVLFLGYQNCLTIPDIKIYSIMKGFDCGSYNSNLIKYLSSKYTGTPVVVSSRFSAYLYGADESIPSKSSKPLAWFDKQPESTNSSYLSNIKDRFISSMCEISKNRKVTIIKPYPGIWFDVPKKLARDIMIYGHPKPIYTSVDFYNKRNSFSIDMIDSASNECGINTIDPTDALCDKSMCYFNKGSRSIYYDGSHLSEFGNKLMTPLLKDVF